MRTATRPLIVLLTTLALFGAGCMDAGGGQLYVYQLGSQDAQDVSDSFEVTNGRAQVVVQAGSSAGSVRVVLHDAAGDVVFEQSYGSQSAGGAQSSKTVSGAGGTWDIDIDFTNYSGGFQVAVNGV